VTDSVRRLIGAAADLRPVIRGYQEEIECEQRLPTSLIEQLRAAGVYRMVVPCALGGLQVDALTYLQTVEQLAEGDGSVGWNIANNAISTLHILSLPDEGIQEVFARGPDLKSAGAAVPGGATGRPVGDAYAITGCWRFGSGCSTAEWMVGSFEIVDNDIDVSDVRPAGARRFRRAVFHASDCTVRENWQVTGLHGTGSHDWAVSNVFVPRRRTAEQNPAPFSNEWSRWSGTLYGLPGHALIGAHHSAVATGIARASIDALLELAAHKVPRRGPTSSALLRDQPQVQEWVGRAEALLGAAQAYRAAVTNDVWHTVATGRQASVEQNARCRLAAAHAVDSALQVTDLMYRAGGTSSIEYSSRLARCWRDVHAVGQAVTVLPEWYPLGGRVFLGMDAGPRLSGAGASAPANRQSID
jgi:indole-3-acetate monooxygenase